MTIREYAKINNHKIIGKLIRHPEYECVIRDGEKSNLEVKTYLDDAGNTYDISDKGCTITTVDGVVI